MSPADHRFDAYVAARSAALLRVAWLLTGDVGSAEDAVQTALARVSLRWDRVLRSDDVHAYVRRAVVNACHSQRRRHRVRQVPLAAAEGRGRLDGELSLVEDRAGIAAALASLPRRQREVLVLRYLEDLSEADTAATLGCSVGTVKSSASRGLASLRLHPALTVDEPVETPPRRTP